MSSRYKTFSERSFTANENKYKINTVELKRPQRRPSTVAQLRAHLHNQTFVGRGHQCQVYTAQAHAPLAHVQTAHQDHGLPIRVIIAGHYLTTIPARRSEMANGHTLFRSHWHHSVRRLFNSTEASFVRDLGDEEVLQDRKVLLAAGKGVLVKHTCPLG
ncbi:uncharacterized protein HD556DRAFT_1311319 [Suillus plorans]|uniref:Uncharacterized protein n=1 Tax=Suillus plorans TaxID=116603 RepID=A0A9P7DEH8_9AGAM|nr:uncharacterized protein HD556DRAFT_1311319 [Suillus plorans]KAG1789560.1 hypothetical protein HD556DRAFT_1311319 [Suillus plorans]